MAQWIWNHCTTSCTTSWPTLESLQTLDMFRFIVSVWNSRPGVDRIWMSQKIHTKTWNLIDILSKLHFVLFFPLLQDDIPKNIEESSSTKLSKLYPDDVSNSYAFSSSWVARWSLSETRWSLDPPTGRTKNNKPTGRIFWNGSFFFQVWTRNSLEYVRNCNLSNLKLTHLSPCNSNK